ncbi:MAG: TRAP transporter substrate-binding protein [Deltaproteobacteria bacterium]|nr:TRAP transporter substrate-binding protein [Deltaproteobacteria bacterium]
MSRLARLAATGLVLLVVATGLGGSARAEDHVMKIATVAPDNTPWSELLKKYKKAVEEKSGGRIKVKVFLGGTLGDENESVIKCKRGQIQAVGASTGAMASQIPEVNVVEIPYLFRNFGEVDYVIDNVLTKPIEEIFPQYGLVFGFWSENGFRQLGTKDKQAKKPADLKGKKMRSQESSIHLDMWKAFGASPVPIPPTEVLTALQTGTVDGFDQAVLYAIAASWYKSVKYFTVSNHIYQAAIIAFNKEWFEKLPPDLQKILVDEGRTLQAKGRKAVRKIIPDLLAVLQGENIQVYELTDAEKKVFEQASLPARSSFRKTQGKKAVGLLDAVEKGLSDFRAGKVK